MTWDDARILWFDVPSEYREWHTLYWRLHDISGRKVGTAREDHERYGQAFIIFDTPEEAIEFKLRNL